MARASARLSPAINRSARVPSAIAGADYIWSRGLGPHATGARGAPAALPRRAAAAPRRAARAAAVPARSPDAHVGLRAARAPARVAEAPLRPPPEDRRLRVRRAGREVRDRPRCDPAPRPLVVGR